MGLEMCALKSSVMLMSYSFWEKPGDTGKASEPRFLVTHLKTYSTVVG